MKELTNKSAIYCPPKVDVFAVATEGLLCVSQLESYQLYDGNDEFEWEGLL